MKKTFLVTFILAAGFANTIFAQTQVPLPLNPQMDENMYVMGSTFEKKLATQLQLQATELYAMGEALLSHEGHAECQALGKKLIESAKDFYQTSSRALKGQQATPDDMKAYVNDHFE